MNLVKRWVCVVESYILKSKFFNFMTTQGKPQIEIQIHDLRPKFKDSLQIWNRKGTE